MIKTILFLFCIVGFSNLYSCQCYSSSSFDLLTYDESDVIVSVKAIKKVDNYDNYLEKYEKEVESWDRSFPAPPPVPASFFSNDYICEVIGVFKGNIQSKTIQLRTDENSSCYWSPRIGDSYLIYLSKPEQNENRTFHVGACNRKIGLDDSLSYRLELQCIDLIGCKPNGKFNFNNLIEVNNDTIKYTYLEGEFYNSQRVGHWVISEPIPHQKVNWTLLDSAIIIEYKNDIIQDIINYKKSKKIWAFPYLFYYTDHININGHKE